MAGNIIPTKGNLMAIKRTLTLAHMGFDLMDRKRNILVREMMARDKKMCIFARRSVNIPEDRLISNLNN